MILASFSKYNAKTGLPEGFPHNHLRFEEYKAKSFANTGLGIPWHSDGLNTQLRVIICKYCIKILFLHMKRIP